MALATSKRKFYKLLDNLSSSKTNLPPSTDDSKQTPLADRPIKRSRMIDANRAYFPAHGSSRTTVRILSSNFEPTLAGNQYTPSRPDSSPSTSTYSPWSHEKFLARLKTFSNVTLWDPKPDSINEVAWAKRGWTVIAHNELSCKSCGERVLIKLDNHTYEEGDSSHEDEGEDGGKWWSAEAEERLVEKYEALIIEGHEKNCLWRKSGSKDDIYRISFSGADIWQQDLCQRYTALAAMSDTLPSAVAIPKVPESQERDQFDIDSTSDWFSSLLKDNDKPSVADSSSTSETQNLGQASSTVLVPPEKQQVNKVALIMALCGWTGQTVAGVRIAYCEKCFARIGLWMYKPSSFVSGEDQNLDPITLHRTHCPWQNPVTQSGLGRFTGLSGWEILNEIISSNIARTQRQKGLAAQADDDLSDTEDGPRHSREQEEDEDRARESKLARLRRAFNVKKNKKSVDKVVK